jgi:hypothetical protein
MPFIKMTIGKIKVVLGKTQNFEGVSCQAVF